MDRVRDLVAAGGVAVVLAQDRDRIAREPSYHYLLRKEFEEYGCGMRSLNDRGDDSPEGELTDGILDQLAKFERAKTAERTRRGKLQKARSGKVVGGHPVNYGFKMDTASYAYEVDERKMAVVRRIFRMVGEEGLAITAVAKILNEEGEPGPAGGRWNTYAVRRILLEDVYKPHTLEEVQELVSAEVAALLDLGRRYGIWWFNRERWRRTKTSEPCPTGEGRVYRSKVVSVPRPREEWVAVPVPDSGIPRETVEAARHIVTNNKPCSSGGDRFWELSGGILRCSECQRRMRTSVTRKKDGKRYFYYSCASRREGNLSSCENRKTQRAERAEAAVWGLVSALLTDPERLRAGLDEMIDRERSGNRGDPDREAKVWLDKLASLDQERRGYLKLAATGRMSNEDLDEALAEVEEAWKAAQRELETLKHRRERIGQLERDKEALLDYYEGMAPEALDSLTPEERHRFYKLVRLQVSIRPGRGLEISWAGGEGISVCENDTVSASTSG
jgi:site-specific DNA recombinase